MCRYCSKAASMSLKIGVGPTETTTYVCWECARTVNIQTIIANRRSAA